MSSEFAYYYTDWIWPRGSTDFIKSMLLFFDGMALSLSSDRAEQAIGQDPVLAIPLAEQGLLVNIPPDSALDFNSAELLASTLQEIVVRYPGFWRYATQPLYAMTSPHWGHGVADSAASEFLEILANRGLAEASPRVGLYEVDPGVASLVFTLFAQVLGKCAQRQGISLQPVTDSEIQVREITQALYAYYGELSYSDTSRSYRDISTITPDVWHATGSRHLDDLANVGVDLSSVPLDEVLDFRRQHGAEYRLYAEGLRRFIADYSESSSELRIDGIWHDRTEELLDQSARLRGISRNAFGLRMAALAFSLAGATWTVHDGDPIGALLAASSAIAQAIPVPGQQVTAYSYLIEARRLNR